MNTIGDITGEGEQPHESDRGNEVIAQQNGPYGPWMAVQKQIRHLHRNNKAVIHAEN